MVLWQKRVRADVSTARSRALSSAVVVVHSSSSASRIVRFWAYVSVLPLRISGLVKHGPLG